LFVLLAIPWPVPFFSILYSYRWLVNDERSQCVLPEFARGAGRAEISNQINQLINKSLNQEISS